MTRAVQPSSPLTRPRPAKRPRRATGSRRVSRRPGASRTRLGWTAPTLIAAGPTRVRLPMRARRAPFAVLVAALVAGGLSALLALNTASAAAELRRHDLATVNADLTSDEQQLTADLAARRAPAALAAAAAKLGMVADTDPGYLTVGRDATVTLQGNPQPARPRPVPQVPSRAPAPPRVRVTSSVPLPGGPR